jgi:hypothetical protein
MTNEKDNDQFTNSIVYPQNGSFAAPVSVADLFHVGDRVGDVNEIGGHVSAGEDHVEAGPSAAQRSNDLPRGDEAVVDGMGYLVEDNDVGAAGGEFLFDGPPTLFGGLAMGCRIVTFPQEPGAEGVDLDKGDGVLVEHLLSRSLPAFHELEDGRPLPPAERAKCYAECRRGLPLPIAGKDDNKSFFVGHTS